MIELSQTDVLVFSAAAVVLGILLLVKGGDWTIGGATYVSEHLGVPPMVVGFTVIAFGTSLPELFVSINANLTGFPGISLGNVVGSNIANVLMVIGLTALLATIHAKAKEVLRDLVVMLAATAVLVLLMFYGVVDRWVGLLMFGFLVCYVIYQYVLAKRGLIEPEEVEEPEYASMGTAVFYLVLGLALVTLGSEILVRGAVEVAGIIGVPEAVIGMTVIAFGTSLPELATCLAAAAKKQTDIIVGNIIGSNVFNILSIIGLTALVKPLVVDESLVDFDMWLMVGSSVVFAIILLSLQKVNRPIGLVFVAGYLAFIASNYAGVVTGLGGDPAEGPAEEAAAGQTAGE